MISIIFDTETTGLLLPSTAPIDKQSKIIELGAVKYYGGKGEQATLSQLINPEIQITEEITKITGITNEDVKDAPTFKEFLPELVKFFSDGDRMYCHNAPFDTCMLKNDIARAEYDEFPWPEEIICTAQEYAPMFSRRPRLHELYEEIMGHPLEQTHRALDDATALFSLLKKDGQLD